MTFLIPTAENPWPEETSSLFLPDTQQRWDWAGMDGLQFARALLGDRVSHIAPFQSLDLTLNSYPCSVLRLCENNFRLSLPTDVDAITLLGSQTADFQIWLKPCAHLGAIALPAVVGLEKLAPIAITKPIYNLSRLAIHSAAPARIEGLAVLVWHHTRHLMPVLELQMAQKYVAALQSKLRHA